MFQQKKCFFIKQTRLSSSVSKEQDPIKLMVLVSKWTQTEVLGLDSIKKFPAISTRLNLNGRASHPSYLQSGLLMMALNNESANQAVMDMYIHNTVAYDEPRLLPFCFRKDYQKQLHVLKKYVTAVKKTK